MDTFRFNFERFKELCEAFGATIKEGDQGITVRGKPVTGKDIFAHMGEMEEYQFPADQETTRCTVIGAISDGRVDTEALRAATLAA